MENKKWSLEEFINLLNKSMPLNLLQKNDKRRTDLWNARLLRSYVTAKKISLPYKEGRNAYYTDKHLEEVKNLLTLQSLGVSSKAMPSSLEYQFSPYSKLTSNEITANANLTGMNKYSVESNKGLLLSTEGHHFIENKDGNNNSALSLLNNMNPMLRNFVKESKEKTWKKVSISEDVEIMIAEKHWDKIELIKQEIKKLIGE